MLARRRPAAGHGVAVICTAMMCAVATTASPGNSAAPAGVAPGAALPGAVASGAVASGAATPSGANGAGTAAPGSAPGLPPTRAALRRAAREKRELDTAEALLRRRLDEPLAGTGAAAMGVLVLREAQGVILRIPARTLFDPDSAHVIPVAIGELPWSAVTQLLRKRRHLAAQINVYSDSLGGREENQKLSEQRAQSLVAALRAAGISAPRLTPQGRGPAAALGGNDTPEGRDQNRRVEVVFALPGS